MILSTSTNLFDRIERGSARHYACEESIRRIAAAGFRHADLCLYNCCGENQPMAGDDWQHWIDGLGEIAACCNLSLTQAHAVIFKLQQDYDGRGQRLTGRCIEAAGRLGIHCLVLHPQTFREDNRYSRRLSFAHNISFLGHMAERAAQLGVGLAIENLAENEPCCGDSAEDLIELADRLNIGICWDTGHGNLSGADQPAALRAIGRRLHALHINDNHGQRDEHLAPYMGTIQWAPILAALQEIGYTGDFAYEVQGFTDALPAALHDSAARFLYDMGKGLLAYEER